MKEGSKQAVGTGVSVKKGSRKRGRCEGRQ